MTEKVTKSPTIKDQDTQTMVNALLSHGRALGWLISRLNNQGVLPQIINIEVTRHETTIKSDYGLHIAAHTRKKGGIKNLKVKWTEAPFKVGGSKPMPDELLQILTDLKRQASDDA